MSAAAERAHRFLWNWGPAVLGSHQRWSGDDAWHHSLLAVSASDSLVELWLANLCASWPLFQPLPAMLALSRMRGNSASAVATFHQVHAAPVSRGPNVVSIAYVTQVQCRMHSTASASGNEVQLVGTVPFACPVDSISNLIEIRPSRLRFRRNRFQNGCRGRSALNQAKFRPRQPALRSRTQIRTTPTSYEFLAKS